MCSIEFTWAEGAFLIGVLIVVVIVAGFMVRDYRRDAEDRKRRSYGMAPKRKENR